MIYGFYSIGFHWSLEYYLDDLEALMQERSLLVCTLNKSFRRFPRLEEFSTRVLDLSRSEEECNAASAFGSQQEGRCRRWVSHWPRLFLVKVREPQISPLRLR